MVTGCECDQERFLTAPHDTEYCTIQYMYPRLVMLMSHPTLKHTNASALNIAVADAVAARKDNPVVV